MAIDVTQIPRMRDNSLGGEQDTEIVKRMMIIAGGALVVLVAIKLGFLQRVLP
jgi:hypothetical protein